MKTTNRIIALAAAALALFSSCAKETPWQPGEKSGKYNVYFSNNNPSTVVLGLTDKTFTIVAEREDGTGSLSVPVKFWCSGVDIASAPSVIEFAPGETLAKYTVTLGGSIEPFTKYQASIAIDEQYTQAYKDQDVYSTCGFVFYQEDYKPYADGLLLDFFWNTDSSGNPIPVEATLEYSELQKKYRIQSVWAEGVHFVFGWDGADKFTLGSKFGIGISYGSYGAIYATPDPKNTLFDKSTNSFQFTFEFTVSAGSFGSYPVLFGMLKKY